MESRSFPFSFDIARGYAEQGLPTYIYGGSAVDLNYYFDNKGNPVKITKNYNRIGFVPLDEKVGFQMANYKMNVNITSYSNRIDINVNSFNTPVSDGNIVPSGKATLIVDGQAVSSRPLQTSGDYISSMYTQPVGSTSFNLSNNSNNVAIKFQGGWTMFYNDEGAYVPVYHPIFFPKTININQTIRIR